MPRFLLFLVIIFFNHTALSNIIQTNDINIIEQEIKKAPINNTLFIFDIDDVLLLSKDQILHPNYKKDFHIYLESLSSKMTKEEFMSLRSIIFLDRKSKLVESRMLELLSSLNEENRMTVALTKCYTGELGKISQFKDFRIEELKKFGIKFNFLNNEKKYIFPNINSDITNIPMLKSDIIFTAKADKGIVLNGVLDKFNLNITKIVFIDDKNENLKSVEEIASKRNISYTGIEYTIIKDSPIEPLNKHRADLQFNFLEKRKKWLSDEEIDREY